MAQSRQTKRPSSPQKKQKTSKSGESINYLRKESQRQDKSNLREPQYDRSFARRSDYFNEPIEYQGSGYDYPDRSEEPFYRNSPNPVPDFDRYTQGSFWQSHYSPQEFIGPHAGKGPKAYQRSDERIQEDVYEMLTRHPSIDAQDIEVEVKNGEVTLSGTVPERRMKYFAEEGAANRLGVVDVVNNIRIKRTEENRETTTSSSSTH